MRDPLGEAFMWRSALLAVTAALLLGTGSCAPAPVGEPVLWRIADADKRLIDNGGGPPALRH